MRCPTPRMLCKVALASSVASMPIVLPWTKLASGSRLLWSLGGTAVVAIRDDPAAFRRESRA